MPDIPESELVQTGAIPPDDFHDAIEGIIEVHDWDIFIPTDLDTRLKSQTEHLLIDPHLLTEIAAALITGHVVLQGPPGTGKSSLATAICRAFGADRLPVTAHEDWSTFELIGRQELRVRPDGVEEIIGVNGFFTEAAIRCAGSIVKHFDDPTEPQATWLVIDEINRAHLDKAFGELFTVLGTDELVPITLPHQRLGNNTLVTPRRFRVIATLNSFDKQFVNSLSMGLRRRFTFITVDIPPRRSQGEPWGSGAPDASLASKEFNVVIANVARRLARRIAPDDSAKAADDIREFLSTTGRPYVEATFELVEKVRYASVDDQAPFVPLGTAPLIDVLELFVSLARVHAFRPESLENALDWAASVKLAPLFDTADPPKVRDFADQLKVPFSHRMRRELHQIVAAGLYFV